MKPMTRRTAIGSAVTECPATRPSPDVGRRSVARKRMVVLLPAPLGPMNPKTSPLPMEKESPSTATKSPYRLVKLITSIMHQPLCESIGGHPNPSETATANQGPSSGGFACKQIEPADRNYRPV